MPKSASSFLTLAVGSLPGMHVKPVAIGGGRNEQALNPVELAHRDFTAYVAQHHVRYGDTTAALIEEFGLTPIVLVRNLADAAISIRDHLRNEDFRGAQAWLTKEHTELEDAELENLIADLILPWYVAFYVGWKTCRGATFLTYDQVRGDPAGAVRTVADASSITASPADIEGAVAVATAQAPRFNKGVSGRGAALSDYANERIRGLLAYYPDVDFSLIA